MLYPSLRQIGKIRFQDIIPIYKEIDLRISAQEAYLKLGSQINSFLLESARVSKITGRFSFLGISPFLIFKSKGNLIQIEQNGKKETFFGSPIEWLRSKFNEFKSARLNSYLPNFTGGAVGYFGYDARHYFENLPRRAIDDLKLPDIYLLFFDTVVAFDHIYRKTYVISNIFPSANLKSAYDEACAKIDEIGRRLKKSVNSQLWTVDRTKPKKNFFIQSNFTRKQFEDIVKRAKEYIKKGDIYQANLSQRLSTRTYCEPFSLYRILTRINPSPFACFLNFDEVKIVSSSPERLLKLEDRLVQTRPIAGTRPRGITKKEDRKLSSELMLNEKERAEHIMLVDLERNDLGRVCEYGTVRVNELMILEKYSHVIHIVSNVKGILRKPKDRFDLLAATFPGGTITGTPKIRCMEIIDELEPVTRNIYTGSIGYLSFCGGMDLNIVIRTFVIKENLAYVQVGAGIVWDSDPTREYYETLFKAEALIKTLKYVN